MKDPFQVVRDFEAALCDYTGARFAVTTTSCTMALLLVVAWKRGRMIHLHPTERLLIHIPKHTYVGVPMSIIHAGCWPAFREETWSGAYRLQPFRIWDCARTFTGGMYAGRAPVIFESRDNYNEVNHIELPVDCSGQMLCVSFHPSKILGISTHGGAILHDDPEADAWLRRARFDGRAENIAPRLDHFPQLGWHCYMNPVTAAEGLEKLSRLPRYNADLPNSDYPDLSTLEVFR